MEDRLSKDTIKAVMRAMGRRGGKKRAENLSPEELSAIGKRAVESRIRKLGQTPGGKRRAKKTK